MAKPVFALVDCANFYCSCERVFRPDLMHRPVAVLSNNDGCVVARSEEVKALGIKMGVPYFKCRDLLEQHKAEVFSSNYALYADLSHRVMQVLDGFTPDKEVYSIDEAFLQLEAASSRALRSLGGEIRQRVLKHTGIPVRVGMAETKTLSKLASERAKSMERKGRIPIYSLFRHRNRDRILAAFPVRELWGIGPAYSKKLQAVGITTALGLRDAPDPWIRRHLTVVGLRTAWELRGISCLPLEMLPPTRKGITRSRSFSEPVTHLDALEEAVSTHVSRAAEKLRQAGLVAAHLLVFATTKEFGRGPHISVARGATLPQPTAYTPDLIRAARTCLARCYLNGFAYRKAGVILTQLTPHQPVQLNLFSPDDPKQAQLMAALDSINQRMGRSTVYFASCGIKRPWSMKQSRRSPCYTTRWQDLPIVH